MWYESSRKGAAAYTMVEAVLRTEPTHLPGCCIWEIAFAIA
jgi:hypothetical protein